MSLALISETEEIKRRKAVAKEHFDAIKEAGALHSTTSMRIGYHAYRLKAENLFGVLGFADENEARVAAGVGESTWYANIRLAEQFKDLPEKRFVAMKQANAKALADLPESKRMSTEWVRMAETMKCDEFAARVDTEMEGKARPSDGRERSTSMKLDMPASRKAVIEEKVKEFAESHGVDAGDTGHIFELMCVETTDGVTLVGAITNALQQIKAAKEILRGELSAEEALLKVEGMLDEIVLGFSAALEQAAPDVAA